MVEFAWCFFESTYSPNYNAVIEDTTHEFLSRKLDSFKMEL